MLLTEITKGQRATKTSGGCETGLIFLDPGSDFKNEQDQLANPLRPASIRSCRRQKCLKFNKKSKHFYQKGSQTFSENSESVN